MSNFKREYFVCKKCNGEHRIETLIEYPLPENISNVSSGKVKGELKVISKNVYSVDQDLFFYTSLIISISDFYDDLEIRNWVKVKKSEWKNMKDKYYKIKDKSDVDKYKIVAEGIMVYPIPFYGMSDYPIVKLVYGPNDLMPKVELAISTNQLYIDWKYGISMNRFEEILSYLYHV